MKQPTNNKERNGKIYCELCGFQDVLIEPPHLGVNPKDGVWGDIMCGKCHLVIGTIKYDIKPSFLKQVHKEYNEL